MIEKIKPVVLEFEYREKLESKCFLLEFSHCQDTDDRRKDNESLIEYWSTSAALLNVFLIKVRVAEN